MTKGSVLIFLIAILLSACTVRYKMVGKFDNYNELIQGDLVHDLLAGVAQISAETEKTGIKCDGSSRVTYVPPFSMGCNGQKGIARLRCDDGRMANAEWTATSCATGFGYGQTTDGNGFQFTFGLTAEEAISRLAEMTPEVAHKPDLPAYRPKETREEKGFSTGTGFFVTSDGYLVTNFHVIEDSKKIAVTIDGKLKEAVLVKADPANDVALLKIDTTAESLPIPEVAQVARADEVFTLGYPDISIQGQAQKATFGRINALSGIKDDIRFFQVDVPIQPGNSGGPLIDEKGEVIGIVTLTLNAIVSLIDRGSLPQNVNYAVKTDYVVPLLRDIPSWTPSQSPNNKSLKELVAAYEKSVVLVIAR